MSTTPRVSIPATDSSADMFSPESIISQMRGADDGRSPDAGSSPFTSPRAGGGSGRLGGFFGGGGDGGSGGERAGWLASLTANPADREWRRVDLRRACEWRREDLSWRAQERGHMALEAASCALQDAVAREERAHLAVDREHMAREAEMGRLQRAWRVVDEDHMRMQLHWRRSDCVTQQLGGIGTLSALVAGPSRLSRGKTLFVVGPNALYYCPSYGLDAHSFLRVVLCKFE